MRQILMKASRCVGRQQGRQQRATAAMVAVTLSSSNINCDHWKFSACSMFDGLQLPLMSSGSQRVTRPGCIFGKSFRASTCHPLSLIDVLPMCARTRPAAARQSAPSDHLSLQRELA